MQDTVPQIWGSPLHFIVMARKNAKSLKTPATKIMSNNCLLVCYAVVDYSAGYRRGHALFFVDGKGIGRGLCLAICNRKNLRHSAAYYCDRDWTLLEATTDYSSTRRSIAESPSNPARRNIALLRAQAKLSDFCTMAGLMRLPNRASAANE